MTRELISKDVLSADLMSVHDLRAKAQQNVLSSYHQLEQSMQRGEEVAASVSSSFDQLSESNQMLVLPQELISQLITARKLLLTIDIISGGESTLLRLETLLKLPTPDRALKLAADSLATARTAGAENDVKKIMDTLAHWEMNQEASCIVPLTVPLVDWSSKLFSDISQIEPSPLLTDTIKTLSLHTQTLAQQVNRAYCAFTVCYNNMQNLSVIRSTDGDALLLDIYDHSIKYLLNKIWPILSSSIDAILNSAALEQDSSASCFQLISNLIARFIDIIEHYDSQVQLLTHLSAQSIISNYAKLHRHVLEIYGCLETDQTSSTLVTLLLNGELEHFEALAEYSFQRIRHLERVPKEFIHSLETNVVQQTLSKLSAQHESEFELLTMYLLAKFVSTYTHDSQLREKFEKTYETTLNNFAEKFITEVRPELLIIAQTQDPSLFIESLCTMLETQNYSYSFMSEVASTIIKHATLMLVSILIQTHIPSNQVHCLKQAFKEIAASLRNTLKLPAAQICSPLLSLQSILTATSLEEATELAKDTCFETVSSTLIRSYFSTTSTASMKNFISS